MRKDKKECKKGQETTIGKIIYSFLLFMPLLAIGTTCLISTFNMSAKEETEIHYKYETNEVNSNDDLIIGNVYHFKNFYVGSQSTSNLEMLGLIFNIQTDYSFSVDDVTYTYADILNYSQLYITNDTLVIYTPTDYYGDAYLVGLSIDDGIDYGTIECDIVLQVFRSYDGTSLNSDLFKDFTVSDYNEIESVETHNLNAEDVFYHSVDKVTESPLFNWAENSIIYTTMSSTCTALSITTPFIPLLMSYWLIISVIYFLYDIALMLIWLIHRKIHELQESL